MNEFDLSLHRSSSSSGVVQTRRVLLVASHPDSLIGFRGPLIADMIGAGLRVSVTAPDIDEETRAALGALGAEIHDVDLSRKGMGLGSNLGYMRALRDLMKRVKPDLVINYTVKPNIWGSFAAGSLGIRSVAMVTGLGHAFYPGRNWRARLAGIAVRFLYRFATRRNFKVIFQNPDDCETFIRSGCLEVRSKAALVNGSGLDINHFSVKDLPDAPVFLMIARLLVSKGVMDYAAAAKIVKRQVPEARCLLVGFLDDVLDGISRADLDACVADGVEFLGRHADVRPVIEQASVYVLPSYREGTPRSVLEAMAMGRAVVTTDVPGCRETTVDGRNGFLVPARDPATLADAMLKLARDADLRRTMGRQSRLIAEEKYDVRKVNGTLMAHLEILW